MKDSVSMALIVGILIIGGFLFYLREKQQELLIRTAILDATASSTTVSEPPVVFDYPEINPPSRKYHNPAIPINVPTRGPPEDYQQVGVLTNSDNSKILALYGRQTFTSSHKWNYFTTTDRFHQIKLPVHNESRNCTAEFGCDELYEGDSVRVPQYDEAFTVSIYELEKPRYIPIV